MRHPTTEGQRPPLEPASSLFAPFFLLSRDLRFKRGKAERRWRPLLPLRRYWWPILIC